MSEPTDPDPVDPVEKRSRDDEREVLVIAQLDAVLDDEQSRLDRLAHDDPVGVIWFGDNDDWIDEHLPEAPH